MRDSRVASPGFWPTAGAPSIIYIALVAFSVWPAQGQTKKPGVGLPGAPAAFNRYWCDQTRPPTRAATCTSFAPATFDCRLCPSSGWRGFYAEFFPFTRDALETCWKIDFWGTKSQYDGVLRLVIDPVTGEFTGPEFDWMQVQYSKLAPEYRRCWYEETWPGGKRENPLIIDETTLRFNAFRVQCMKDLGAWPKPGETGSYIGYDITHPVDVCTNAFRPAGARPTLPVWVRNALPPDHPVNTGAPPPPPPPPVPPPIPPPSGPPECEPLEGSRFLRSCRNRTPPLEAAECRELAARNPNSTLASLLARVCPELPPPPPPAPPPPVETCTPGGWECTWEGGRRFLKPGAPSTAVLIVEVVCRQCEVEP